MNRFLTALTALTLASGSALAADLPPPVYKAPPPPPPSWTGCYVGAGGGYGMNNLDGTEVTTATGAFVVTEGTGGGRGWFGQVQGGCDYQFSMGALGDFVVGAFGDFDPMDLTGSHVGSPITTGIGNLEEDWAWSVGGRIGWLATPQFLTYFSGGFTQTHFKQANYVNFASLLPNGESLAAQTYDGGFFGGGFEYAVRFFPGLFLKTEYRFGEYQSRTVANIATATGLPVGTSETLRPFVQTISTELVYRFNWTGPGTAWH
jgi:outer membrane immunogenic protein